MMINNPKQKRDMDIQSKLLTVIALVLSTSANSALVSRLGGLAYYDDVADLTWLTDANAGAGSAFDDGGSTTDGAMTWSNANAWAAGLNISGVTGWRLPDTVDVGNDGGTFTNIYQGVDFGYNITAHSELSNMFYNVLGNTARYDTSGTETGCLNACLTNAGPFSNLQVFGYWSATEYATNANHAWVFFTSDGYQSNSVKGNLYHAWAVQSGDVSPIPVPAAVWLFGSGLLGLIGVARRKKA